MAVKPIITMGHPTLRKTAETVAATEFNTPKLNSLIQDLIDTMQDAGGIGIAAPQIDVAKQVCIVDVPQQSNRYHVENVLHQRFIIINPTLTVVDARLQAGLWEGCLSVPGIRGFVERASQIKVDYFDPQGQPQSFSSDGFLAVVFQHELDHLFGKLFVDRVADTSLISFEENLA